MTSAENDLRFYMQEQGWEHGLSLLDEALAARTAAEPDLLRQQSDRIPRTQRGRQLLVDLPNLVRGPWTSFRAEQFGITILAIEAEAAAPPETGFNSEYAKGWNKGIDTLVAALNQEAAKYGWGRIDDVKVRNAASALREVANAAAPAEPPALDVERLAETLRSAPSLLLEGDDRDRREFAQWIVEGYGGAAPERLPSMEAALRRMIEAVKITDNDEPPLCMLCDGRGNDHASWCPVTAAWASLHEGTAETDE